MEPVATKECRAPAPRQRQEVVVEAAAPFAASFLAPTTSHMFLPVEYGSKGISLHKCSNLRIAKGAALLKSLHGAVFSKLIQKPQADEVPPTDPITKLKAPKAASLEVVRLRQQQPSCSWGRLTTGHQTFSAWCLWPPRARF